MSGMDWLPTFLAAAEAKKKKDPAFLLVPAQDVVGQFLMTFKDYPPRMKAASFSLDKVMEQLSTPTNN